MDDQRQIQPATFLDLLNAEVDTSMLQLLPTEVQFEADLDLNVDPTLAPTFVEPTSTQAVFEDFEDLESSYEEDFLMNIDNQLETEVEENDEEEIPDGFNQLLSKAKEAGRDLAKGEHIPNLWENIDMEEEWSQFNVELRITSGIGKPTYKRKACIMNMLRGPRRKNIPPEIRTLMGEANQHYINKEFSDAINVLQEVLKKDPNIYRAWHTLGLIHDEVGEPVKALQLYLVAAHLTPKNGEEWKRLGFLSKKQNALDQAIYCYSKALRVDPSDVDAIWDRSVLLNESGQYKKAIDGFNHLLKIIPHDMNVIKQLTSIYTRNNELEKAISLYEDALQYYQINNLLSLNNLEDTDGIFSLSDVNIMAELYFSVGEYQKAIECIKSAVRWLQGRENEKCGLYAGGSKEPLPMELRVKLGQCRLMLDQIEEGKFHFNYLFENSVNQYLDLYYEVAETFIEKSLFNDALNVYEMIIADKTVDSSITWSQMGLCHRELGNLDIAAEFYNIAIKKNPGNLEITIILAEIYEEMGENKKALEIVNQGMPNEFFQVYILSDRITVEIDFFSQTIFYHLVLAARNTHHPSTIESSLNTYGNNNFTDQAEIQQIQDYSLSQQADTNKVSIIKKRQEAKSIAYAKAQEARQAKEAEKQAEILMLFHKLDLLSARSALGDQEALDEYFTTARLIMQEWKNTKAFYPKDRMKRFTGIPHRRGARRKNVFGAADDTVDADIEETAKNMAKRLKRQIAGFADDDGAPGFDINRTQFLGKSFQDWLEFFIKYAITAVTNGNEKEAYEVLKAACAANVFYHNEGRRFVLKMLLMACGLYSENYEIVCECARWLCTNTQFRSNVYQIYCASMTSGTKAVENFASANSQKYFIRQIKAMHYAIEGKKNNTGINSFSMPQNQETSEQHKQQPNNNSTFQPTKRNAALLVLYGHILACARSYVFAIGYYLQAHSLVPDDPLINLCLGIAYLHMSMQRQSDNRHLQIMQGFTFLLKYYDLQTGKQEAEYNLGRAFHHLGLFHLAVQCYEQVLKLPSLRKQLMQEGNQRESEIETVDPRD
ncbi:8678_t:CDS:10 [Ambispora leptoticha]|uniref:8678_t:CDS:1 n=1 Tax=Ambispora leptoticha TaxID=144679 RepID=A0A9N8VAQ0_9GLOM|nr:8678_t:CDS:10 [Ambispora leptoticha]